MRGPHPARRRGSSVQRRPVRSRALALSVAVAMTWVVLAGFIVAPASAAFSSSKTISRTHLVDGKDVVVEQRSFAVTVDQTTGLRDRQSINVSWKGAHPSGGIVADANSSLAANQEEYPVVLLQCRGLEGAGVAAAQLLKRETCFTQTSSERFSAGFGSAYPVWRLDRNAPLAERQQYVGAPSPRPASCSGKGLAERWLPMVASDGTVYGGGPAACLGLPPEASELGSLSLPGNTTYATTSTAGTGAARFNVRTAENNASLGCSSTVPCSLVVVPVVGISCDTTGVLLPADQRPSKADADFAGPDCTATGQYAPGAPFQGGRPGDRAVTGALWWSESNWRNRIVVPLRIAASSSVCDIVGRLGVDFYGSEVMAPAAQQWAPSFCLDGQRTPFKHVQTGEPQARNLLKVGTISAALVSGAPSGGYGKPVVTAPVALSGFAIGFAVDDVDQRDLPQLTLTPRLLAKLLTESYPSISIIKHDYVALSGNPLTILADPEFIALNPQAPKHVGSAAAATLLNLSSGSDAVGAMTAYVNADKEARAWLDGAADPWGMKVNPNYKAITLPVDQWELRDTFEPLSYYKPGTNDCLAAAPVPYLPLVAAPLGRLSQIALAMQYSLANPQLGCILPSVIPGNTDGAKLVAEGRQTPGFRFMLGLLSLGDAERYQVHTAALQTAVNTGAPALFTNAAGRTFTRPTATALRAGAAALVADEASGTYRLPYGSLGAAAYPGTMLVSAAVPTSGLSKADAAGFAGFLRFAAAQGQVAGPGNGQLPAGFLPMTAANGMGALAAYTRRAADAVSAQSGQVPTLLGSGNVAPVGRSSGGSAGGATGLGAVGSAGPGSTPGATGTSGAPVGVSVGGTASVTGTRRPAVPPSVAAVASARTRGASTSAGGLLPLLLILGVVGSVLGPLRLLRAR